MKAIISLKYTGSGFLIPALLIFMLGAGSLFGQFEKEVECFSILVGKNATENGEVLFAHNEDDWGDWVINWYKVPALNHKEGEKIRLKNGAEISQSPQTYSYLWLQMPGMQFSDSYMNQWGVTVASDQCRSREDKGELTDGGIGFYLRRIMAERAKTAREAVKIAGALIDSLGYNYSGRTYCIADPQETWMMAVVKGKHWVAQRIPDDHVAVIANCYTIDEVNLSDTLNFLTGKNNIIDYAVKRGWYNPEEGKKFSFRESYAAPYTLKAIWNTPRFMTAVNKLSEKQYGYYDNIPFSFKPAKKVKKQDLMFILANHLEGTDFESCGDKNPHFSSLSRICSPGNQYGFVTQLRDEMPAEIAFVMWIAIKRPCTQAFVPWYFGLQKIPADFTFADWRTALKYHFSGFDWKKNTQGKAYWDYKKLSDYCDEDYYKRTERLKETKKRFENAYFSGQQDFERKFADLYKKDKDLAIKLLQNYNRTAIMESLNNTRYMYKLLTKEN